MGTEKKHIAVYLDPAIEAALIEFCEQKGLISKKGTMFSAGVNKALAQFFGVESSAPGNTASTIPDTIPDNLDQRIAEIVERKMSGAIEQLRTELGESAA